MSNGKYSPLATHCGSKMLRQVGPADAAWTPNYSAAMWKVTTAVSAFYEEVRWMGRDYAVAQ